MTNSDDINLNDQSHHIAIMEEPLALQNKENSENRRPVSTSVGSSRKRVRYQPKGKFISICLKKEGLIIFNMTHRFFQANDVSTQMMNNRMNTLLERTLRAST